MNYHYIEKPKQNKPLTVNPVIQPYDTYIKPNNSENKNNITNKQNGIYAKIGEINNNNFFNDRKKSIQPTNEKNHMFNIAVGSQIISNHNMNNANLLNFKQTLRKDKSSDSNNYPRQSFTANVGYPKNNPYDMRLNKANPSNNNLSHTMNPKKVQNDLFTKPQKSPKIKPNLNEPKLNNTTNKKVENFEENIKNNNIYNPAAKSVKEYSYYENKNSRPYMEDFHKIVDKFMNDPTKGLFCLYDGHGGSEPVIYVKERFPDLFKKNLMENKHNTEKAIIFTLQKIDDELKIMSESQNAGTTACIIYIYKENDIIQGVKRILYCGNVGDTRALLITSKETKRLSYDHKCSDKNEVERIRKVGGIVFNDRVFGQLALSRAIGDHAMKKYGVISTPSIYKHIIGEKDRYVVICSDGVWDVLSDEEVFTFSQTCSNAGELSKYMIEEAIKKESRDNLSCIAIKLN